MEFAVFISVINICNADYIFVSNLDLHLNQLKHNNPCVKTCIFTGSGHKQNEEWRISSADEIHFLFHLNT